MRESSSPIADEAPSKIDNEFQVETRSLGQSGTDLPTSSTLPSAHEQEMLQVDGKSNELVDGDGVPKKSSTKILRAWVVVGALAAVLIVIVTLIQMHVIDWPKSSARNNSPSASYAAPTSSASPNEWPNKRWTGELLLSGNSNGGADLSSVPPNVNSNSGNEDVSFIEGAIYGSSPIAAWNGKGSPTARVCATLVNTEGVNSIIPKPGHAICVKTAQGDIAILVVKKNNVDKSGTATSSLVQATVWFR
jgi:hypothetical protein